MASSTQHLLPQLSPLYQLENPELRESRGSSRPAQANSRRLIVSPASDNKKRPSVKHLSSKKELTPAKKLETTPAKKKERIPVPGIPGIGVPSPSRVLKQQQTQIISKRNQVKNTLTGHTQAPVQESRIAPTSKLSGIITGNCSLNPDLVEVKTVKTQKSLIGTTPQSRSIAPTPILRETTPTPLQP